MTSRTRWKLNEASFFLGKMDEHYYDHLETIFSEKQPQPVFSFYLSAFVSAARSVTWLMRAEYDSVVGWEAWFKGLAGDATEQQRKLLTLFTDLRNRTQKAQPLPLGMALRFIGEPDTSVRDSRMPKRLSVTVTAVDEFDRPINLGEVAAVLWTIDELDGEDLLLACKEYLGLLTSVVDQCEAKFGVRQSYEPIENRPTKA